MTEASGPPTEASPVGPGNPGPAGQGRRLPRHLRWLLAIAVVVTALVVVSVFETLRSTSTPSGGAGGVSVGFFKPKSSQPVAFSLPLLTSAAASGNVTLASDLGKPLVINLWSTTCTVCVKETPAIESVARKVGGDVKFVGIDTLDERGPAQAFVRRYGVTYQELFDPQGTVADAYGAPGLPVSIFVSGSGRVVGENLGALTTTSLTHYLETLFGTPASGSTSG